MSNIKVFKFGGASVNSAQAIRNMASIVKSHLDTPLVVVISAMGKTTNALEHLVPGVLADDAARHAKYEEVKAYHTTIFDELVSTTAVDVSAVADARNALQRLFADLEKAMTCKPTDYNYDYDQTVSFGELISTTLISGFLNSIGISNLWLDVRRLVRTDDYFREGHVDWLRTGQQVQQHVTQHLSEHPLVITQGFIAGTILPSGAEATTTLGREGSDYSASILSYCLGASEMTIWKDVPGFLNADPKYFDNTIKINKIPYNEAIELAYYGASVIHPKTVKPIQNKGIRLNIKSFVDPSAEGSVVGPFFAIDPLTPLYIFKNNQVLISILPKDFSFIAEDNLQTIFALLARLNVKVNMMQNSALSFSFCIDFNQVLLSSIQEALAGQFRLRYNTGLQLITIRYYNQEIIDRIVGGRNVLLQQRSRTTTQLIVE